MNYIEKQIDYYRRQSEQWLDLQIDQYFQEVSPKIKQSAKVILTTDKNPMGIIKAASGKHSNSLVISVEKIGKYHESLYLYSSANYDKVILTGEPFELPMPSTLFIWIRRKARRGVDSFREAVTAGRTKNLAYAIYNSMKKRGFYATHPFDYVGFTIDKEKDYLIKRFLSIGKKN